MATRHPQEIRASIETTREDLTYSVNDLQSKIDYITDWRRHLRAHRQQAVIGAAVAGFVIGGGIAAVVTLFKSD
jgi:dienelactone hydrolase